MEEKRRIYLPRGVSAGKDFIPGFGYKELLQSLFLAAGLLPVVMGVFLLLKTTEFLLLALMGMAAVSFLLCLKNEGNSVFEMGKRIVTFYQGRRWYPYHGYREEEDEETKHI